MLDAVILWSHALAALLFAAVALWAARAPGDALPRWPLVVALGALAAWMLAAAGLGNGDPATGLAQGIAALALIGAMIALHQRGARPAQVGIATVYGVLAAIAIAATLLQLFAAGLVGDPRHANVADAAALFRMMVAVAALVLLQNLHAASERGDARLICFGIAIVWFAQLSLSAAAYIGFGGVPALVVARGLVLPVAAAIVAVALQRGDRGTVRVSRTVAYQSLSIVAIGGYFTLLALVTSALSAVGGANARIYQTAFVFGSTAALLTLLSSPWLRAWAKVKVAKHLFQHRYDYRSEWIRFTGTLGDPRSAVPLDQRIVKAVADLTDSPAGLLLVPDGPALGVGAGWNWRDLPSAGASEAFAAHLLAGERIVELDPLRRADAADGGEAALLPRWMLDDASGWAVVPLVHRGQLAGAILLARPPLDRALDWEDFDLLRIAGRQAASYLAEARAQEALAEGQRFDEFNRRFAFIVHDIKNLVSGLSLVARNAERHADKPEFRADMVATLQDSAAKLNALLARLSANHRGRAEPPAAIDLYPVAERVAAARRASHPVVVAGGPVVGVADAARLEQIIGHLVQNAIEASGPADPVTIALEDRGSCVAVAVIDSGCGMSPAFVRDQLFRPFVSSKPGGFGIGAFEARQLAEAMGATIEVTSREDEGTAFRVVMPAALAPRLGVAA